MIRTLMLIYLLINYSLAWAVDLGVYGQVWPIDEVDIRDIIVTQSEKISLEAVNELFKAQIHSDSEHFNTGSMPSSQVTKTHYFEPVVTLKNDIVVKDTIIYKKGTSINPLTKINPNRALLFFDGNSKNQINFAVNAIKQYPFQLLLVMSGHNPIQLSHDIQLPVYYAYPPLINYFHVNHMPALINNGRLTHQYQLAITEFSSPFKLSTLKDCWNGC
jgi:hypothetical protein